MERCTLVSVPGAVADGAHEAPVDAGASAHLTDGHGGEVARYLWVSGFGMWGRFLVVPILGPTGGPRSTALISQSAIPHSRKSNVAKIRVQARWRDKRCNK